MLLTDHEDRPVAGLQQGQSTGLDGRTSAGGSSLGRLVDVMTAPYLREVLGVSPRALGTDSGLQGVGFDLPLTTPVPTP